MADGTEPIPGPKGLPFLGNVTDINPEAPLQSFCNFADQYGPIYQLNFVGKVLNIVSTNALINEVCDESRFVKNPQAALAQVRNGLHDGLFTARPGEDNWGIAHRVLVPAFGPMPITAMFDEMSEITSQLALKWAREGPSSDIMVTDDFTRLTLDTLALTSMDYRFNSFYHDELHPFIQSMSDFLLESGSRGRRPKWASYFLRSAETKYWKDIETFRKTASEIIEARKANPTDRKDLLSAMLEGKDPKTGRKMTDDSIIDNLVTFLVAGHETTSGLTSFAFYQLLNNPEAYRKVQEEVDRVVGSGPVGPEHMSKLPYCEAVLRESLRLNCPIPIFSVQSVKDQLLGGKYFVKKGGSVLLLLQKAHVDPVVFGDDAEEFKPERMLADNFDRLTKEFPNCWKPFGNGSRACIGRAFGWQECLLLMAVLFQNFNFTFSDPNYQLSIHETLTAKPRNFYMRAVLREAITPMQLEQRLSGVSKPGPTKTANGRASGPAKTAQQPIGKPMNIYYGSNSGTCEALAQRLASDAATHGFAATVVDPLDLANQKLPTDRPVVIITASYEGEPPDNAAGFVSWLQSLKGKELENVSYAVYGCGHRDWAQTFHRVPMLIDSTIESRGGTRMVPIGLTDCSEGNMFTDFETWEDDTLWPAMAQRYDVSEAVDNEALHPGLSVEVSTPRTSTLRQDVKEAVVVTTKDLTAPGAPVKKHIEIKLPSDMSYTAGDYLAILPLNPKDNVYRAMRRFQLPWDAHITISAEGRTTLPTDVSIPATDVLGAYVELAQPATKRNILALAEAARDDGTKEKLQSLADDSYATEISAKRVSVLDLLEQNRSIELSFGSFLALLPPMRVRQYSISSSPLWNPSHTTLTYSVLSSPSLSGQGTHLGVASSYLSSLAPGDKLHVSIRPSHNAFHLPIDGENTPLILVAAGSGLAPFRGFIQERAAMLGAGRSLAPAVLYYGCRTPGVDDIYREELDRWEAMGVVEVRRAYSRKSEESKGCTYVQDRMLVDNEELKALYDKGAKVYVCGGRKMGEGVKKAVIQMGREWGIANGKDVSEEAERKWFESIRNERYATDVFD